MPRSRYISPKWVLLVIFFSNRLIEVLVSFTFYFAEVFLMSPARL